MMRRGAIIPPKEGELPNRLVIRWRISKTEHQISCRVSMNIQKTTAKAGEGWGEKEKETPLQTIFYLQWEHTIMCQLTERSGRGRPGTSGMVVVGRGLGLGLGGGGGS